MEIIKIIENLPTLIKAIIGKNSEKKEDKFANEVLALVYEVEDKIKNICNPSIMSDEEFISIIESKKISEKEKNNAKVSDFFKQYKGNKKVFDKLYSQKNRFKVIFGKDKSKPFEDLKEIIDEIGREEIEALILKNKKYDSISNNLSTKVNKILKDIEIICENVIRPKSRFSKIYEKCKQIGKEKDKK